MIDVAANIHPSEMDEGYAWAVWYNIANVRFGLTPWCMGISEKIKFIPEDWEPYEKHKKLPESDSIYRDYGKECKENIKT